MIFNPFSLEKKSILVTGASSGLGVGIAVESSKMGADLIISGRDKDRLSKTYNSLAGCNNKIIVADLNNVSDIESMVANVPILDGLVLCAGAVHTVPVKFITDDSITSMFQTNIISSIQLVSRLLKSKKLSKGASVIFISSVSTFNVKIGNSLYSGTKGAANSFAKCMALEVAKQGIRVNCVQPGFVPSKILENSGIEQEQIIKFYGDRHPLGFGRPEDIAYACIYLLSDAARWVTGSIFTIDGGYTLQ
jgi:NAD(P)-dependent dehydrogenase (short-subunit alcohol dehydrogenase family)